MIFETLYSSSKKQELILIENGYLRFHIRRDGICTIYEIISQHKGVGTKLLNILKDLVQDRATHIVAKCPQGLESNKFYMKKSFVIIGTERTRTGKELNIWQLNLR